MIRLVSAIALFAAWPADAVVIGTTNFGTLINDAVSDNGFPGRGSGTGTVANTGVFPAASDTSAAGRQVWRYTFTLPERSNVRVELGWQHEVDYNCLFGPFQCEDDEDRTDVTFTSGIDRVMLELTRVGGSTKHYDPLATFAPGDFDYFLSLQGADIYSYDRNASLALGPGAYTLDVTGYGAPGGPAFPGSGGGSHDLNLEALAVPEPATWFLLISGFGVTGITLRRRFSRISAGKTPSVVKQL